MYTKYFNSVRPYSHLVGFAKKKLDLSLGKTNSMCKRCSEVEGEYIRISSKYTVQKWSRNSWKTLFKKSLEIYWVHYSGLVAWPHIQKSPIWFKMQSYGDDHGSFQLGDNYFLNQSWWRYFAMSESIQGIIYARYRIPVNYGIAVETSLVYTNSQFPSFLAGLNKMG